MKKFRLFLCILLALSLCACSGKMGKNPASDPTEQVTEAKEEEIPRYVIQTPYYYLSLPDDWEDKCAWEQQDHEDGTYTLNLYEKTSHEEMGAGKLFSIMLLPTSEDWADFPNYTMHGIIFTPKGDYQVVALYPTDVQFTPETADSYNAMAAQVADILSILSPAGGLEMVAPAPIL